MWLLGHRQPERFGKWMDRAHFERHPDGAALELAHRTLNLVRQAHERLDEAEALAEALAEAPAKAPAKAPEGGRPARPGDVA